MYVILKFVLKIELWNELQVSLAIFAMNQLIAVNTTDDNVDVSF